MSLFIFLQISNKISSQNKPSGLKQSKATVRLIYLCIRDAQQSTEKEFSEYMRESRTMRKNFPIICSSIKFSMKFTAIRSHQTRKRDLLFRSRFQILDHSHFAHFELILAWEIVIFKFKMAPWALLRRLFLLIFA